MNVTPIVKPNVTLFARRTGSGREPAAWYHRTAAASSLSLQSICLSKKIGLETYLCLTNGRLPLHMLGVSVEPPNFKERMQKRNLGRNHILNTPARQFTPKIVLLAFPNGRLQPRGAEQPPNKARA